MNDNETAGCYDKPGHPDQPGGIRGGGGADAWPLQHRGAARMRQRRKAVWPDYRPGYRHPVPGRRTLSLVHPCPGRDDGQGDHRQTGHGGCSRGRADGQGADQKTARHGKRETLRHGQLG